MGLAEVLAHIESKRDEDLGTLFELIRRRSISTQGIGVEECAEHLRGLLDETGIAARLISTRGYPVVYGELPSASKNATTILFYGHYDVQPPEPLEEWESDPFEPTIRDGRIYARGVGDNKGQLLAHVLAVRSYLATERALPVNVKFVFEGEEENGSPHLQEFVESNADLLHTDLVYTADGGYDDSGRPLVCFGVRGMLVVELEAHGAKSDLHSGNRGNVVPNPAWQLVDLLGTMRDPNTGRVLIDGFYDDVVEPSEAELELMARIPFDKPAFLQVMGLGDTPVMDSVDYARRLMFQPTLNINGFASGYGGRGIKTIVPARAMLKMDMRLVADQNPADIFEKFVAFVSKHAPGLSVKRLGAMSPSRTSPELPISKAVVEAVRRGRNDEPVVYPALGGSLPDRAWTGTLGVPSILVPYANPDENNHAPNENMELEAFFNGIAVSAYVLDALGAFEG